MSNEIIQVMIARLFCEPTRIPGSSRTEVDSTLLMYTIPRILWEFVEFVSEENPNQAPYFVRGDKLVFSLPLELRGFSEDLRIPEEIHVETTIYSTRPNTAVFLQDREVHILRETSPGIAWVQGLGYDSLQDMMLQQRRELRAWLQLVSCLSARPRPLRLEEKKILEDYVGHGVWERVIPIFIDHKSLIRC